jgi:flavodoxin
MTPAVHDRRTFLRLTAAGLAGVAVTGCGSSAADEEPIAEVADAKPRRSSEILLAYFSRAGENYNYGGRKDLKVGNTKVLARMIDDRLACDVREIKAADPYSRDYDATVARNVREQEADARPEIANPLASIDRYDTIILASPIWNVAPPWIMLTFADTYNFSGKTVLPVTTYAMSGLGSAPAEYDEHCRGARIGRGLAVRGEEVRSGRRATDAWLRRVGLLDARLRR